MRLVLESVSYRKCSKSMKMSPTRRQQVLFQNNDPHNLGWKSKDRMYWWHRNYRYRNSDSVGCLACSWIRPSRYRQLPSISRSICSHCQMAQPPPDHRIDRMSQYKIQVQKSWNFVHWWHKRCRSKEENPTKSLSCSSLPESSSEKNANSMEQQMYVSQLWETRNVDIDRSNWVIVQQNL